MARVLVSVCLLFLTSVVFAATDPYGGDVRVTGSNEDGYFRVEKIGDRYWLTTPDNHGFFSLAHTTTMYNDRWGGFCPPLNTYPNPYGNKAKYNDDFGNWVSNLRNRMDHYGFNSLGAWSQNNIPELTENVRVLFVMQNAEGRGAQKVYNGFVDVWDPKFHEACAARAASLKSSAGNAFTIGAFPDNELKWNGPNVWEATGRTLAECFIDLPASASGKEYFVNTFLSTRYKSLDALNKSWGTRFGDWGGILEMASSDIPDSSAFPARFEDKLDFTEAIADKYYSETTDAMRAADPNHLVFSARWALWSTAYRTDGPWQRHARCSERIWKKAGEYCDIIAVNSYIDLEWLETHYTLFSRLYQNAKKPFMITEWATFADDTAYAFNPGWRRYQKNRAEFYAKQIEYLAGLTLPDDSADGTPVHVALGAQWFQFYDEPSLGRMDLERANFGLYNVKDEAYLTCLDTMRSVNQQVYDRLIEGSPIHLLEPPVPLHPATGKPQSVTDVVRIEQSRPVFEWEAVPGAETYSVLYSPEKCFPEQQTIRVDGVAGQRFEVPEPLSPGRWYWSVAGVDSAGLQGIYAGPVTVDVEAIIANTDVGRFLSMEDLSAWTHTALEDGGWDGTVYCFADLAAKTEGAGSARLVFTINSLNKKTGKRNDETGEIVARYAGPPLTPAGSDRLVCDIMPARVVDASGTMMVASRYLHIRMTDAAGNTVVEEALDPQGGFAPLEWSKVELNLKPEDMHRATSLEFSVACKQEKTPWDQRLTVWVDDIHFASGPNTGESH